MFYVPRATRSFPPEATFPPFIPFQVHWEHCNLLYCARGGLLSSVAVAQGTHSKMPYIALSTKLFCNWRHRLSSFSGGMQLSLHSQVDNCLGLHLTWYLEPPPDGQGTTALTLFFLRIL